MGYDDSLAPPGLCILNVLRPQGCVTKRVTRTDYYTTHFWTALGTFVRADEECENNVDLPVK